MVENTCASRKIIDYCKKKVRYNKDLCGNDIPNGRYKKEFAQTHRAVQVASSTEANEKNRCDGH